MKKTVVILVFIFLILPNFQGLVSSQGKVYGLSPKSYDSGSLKLTYGGNGWMRAPLKDNRMSYQTEGMTELSGVTIITEKNQYPSDVRKIKVFFENRTDKDLLFGNMFYIQKYDGVQWKPLGVIAAFTGSAHRIPRFSEVEHSYSMRPYSNVLEKGTYRFVTDVMIRDYGIINNSNKLYILTSNFNIT